MTSSRLCSSMVALPHQRAHVKSKDGPGQNLQANAELHLPVRYTETDVHSSLGIFIYSSLFRPSSFLPNLSNFQIQKVWILFYRKITSDLHMDHQELNSHPQSHILGLEEILELLRYFFILKMSCTQNSLFYLGLRVHLLSYALYLLQSSKLK